MLNKNACLLPAVTQATDNVRQRLDHSVTLQRGVLGERGWGGERGGGEVRSGGVPVRVTIDVRTVSKPHKNMTQ